MTEIVASADGTAIAYRRVGTGPPVVVVHGGLGSSQSWQRVAERLADRFEFFLLDRRGRGASAVGTAPHSLAREVDDADAVLTVAGSGAAVVGHSFGGAVALELARRAPYEIGRLVLYEPGVRVSGLIPAAQVNRMEALVASGCPEQALDVGLAQLDAAGLVSGGPAAPSPRRTALATITWTLAREIRAVEELGDDLARYTAIDAPSLVLAGTASPPRQRENCEALAAALPRARLVRLEHQGHTAHNGDPAGVAAILGSFLG